MNEEWRPVRGYEDLYEVSSLGRVRSLRVYRGQYGRILSSRATPQGYFQVGLSRNGGTKQALLHRLVVDAFVQPIEFGVEVNHINANKQDNSLANLEVVTSQENKIKAKELGLYGKQIGSINGSAVLNEEQVLEIKRLLLLGHGVAEIDRMFGVTHAAISFIKTGRRWAHVKLTPDDIDAIKREYPS